jgi:SAM-dependent methyltransferase
VPEEEIKFWEDRWQSFIDASPLNRRRNLHSSRIKRWNKMATGFAERTSGKQTTDNCLKTIQWLKDQGALKPGDRVLDIGAGPGNWALLLAQTAAHVTALEPADAMADILQDRIDAKGISNITIDRRTWQAVDLAKDQWEAGFDLVFASMTPGIDGPANLRKMMAACRGFCYLSAFSGRGWLQWYDDLWRAVFNESIKDQPNDIIHSFNLVYAMGYRPNLQFDFREREMVLTREKAMEDYYAYLEGYTELTDEIKATVAAFVDERCENGTFTFQRNGCQGMMVWNINEKVQEP